MIILADVKDKILDRLFLKTEWKNFLRGIWKLISDKEVFFHASAISFNLFVCAIPFSFLLFSIVGFIFSLDEAVQFIYQIAEEFFPELFYDEEMGLTYMQSILDPLVSRKSVLGFLGLGIMIITAQGLFSTAKHTIFDVFDIKDRRHPLVEILSNFFTFGIIGGVFLTFSIFFSFLSVIFVDTITIPVINYTIRIAAWYELVVRSLSLALPLVLFLAVFRYLSEKNVSWMSSLVGSLAYLFMFEISKLMFSLYVGIAFNRYLTLYEGYTFVIITGFWGFYSAIIFVIAAIVARSFQDTFETHFDKNESVVIPEAS